MKNIMKKEFCVDSQLYKDFCKALEVTKNNDSNHIIELCMHWYIQSLSDIVDSFNEDGNPFYGKALEKISHWASHPERYNHKIIRSYFTAVELNGGKATLEFMEKLCSDESNTKLYVPTFKDNYDQMKIDTEKSNGKVFEDNGCEVWIWEKVKDLLLLYKPDFYKE